MNNQANKVTSLRKSFSESQAVQVQDLKKTLWGNTAVDGLTFSVASGEIMGLLGPNGAGKTTTVECLLSLRQPDSWNDPRVRHGHTARAQSRAIRARIGAQLQTTGLLQNLSVPRAGNLFAQLFPRRPAHRSRAGHGGLER